jgi:hypothetical protein
VSSWGTHQDGVRHEGYAGTRARMPSEGSWHRGCTSKAHSRSCGGIDPPEKTSCQRGDTEELAVTGSDSLSGQRQTHSEPPCRAPDQARDDDLPGSYPLASPSCREDAQR